MFKFKKNNKIQKMSKEKKLHVFTKKEIDNILALISKFEKELKNIEQYEIDNYDEKNNKTISMGYEIVDLYDTIMLVKPNEYNIETCVWNDVFFEIMHLKVSTEDLISIYSVYKLLVEYYSYFVEELIKLNKE